MAFDDFDNFGIGVVQTPPSPALSGTQLTLASGQGANFPSIVNGFNALVWPNPATLPQKINAEIVRVTGKVGDVLTITRAQEGSNARAIQQGDYISLHISKKMISDIIANFLNYQPLSSNLTTYAGKTPPSGNVVGDTDIQTLSNKTISNPTTTGTDTGIETLKNKNLSDASNTIPVSNTTTKARAYLSGNQGIPSTTWTKVALNAKTYDPGSNFDAATNHRFTAPVAGKYLVTGVVQFAGMADGSDCWIGFYKNGSQISGAEWYSKTTNRQTSPGLTDILDLAQNDYVELWCFQGSGGTVNVLDGGFNSLAVHLLSLN